MRKKHPIAFLICLGYFSQTASYLIIAGCSKDHDNSRETEIPTTVPTTIHPAFIDPNERKLAIARKEETTSAEPAKGVEAATTIQQALRRHQATQKLRQVEVNH